VWSETIKGQLRHLVTAAGAALIGAKAAEYLTPDMIETVAGVLLLGVGLLLSALAKKVPALQPIIDAINKNPSLGNVEPVSKDKT
jgi:hypothetical protein